AALGDVDDAEDHQEPLVGREVRGGNVPAVAAIRTRDTRSLDLDEPGLPDTVPGVGPVHSPAIDDREVGLQPPLAPQKVGTVQVMLPEPAHLLASQSTAGQDGGLDVDIHAGILARPVHRVAALSGTLSRSQVASGSLYAQEDVLAVADEPLQAFGRGGAPHSPAFDDLRPHCLHLGLGHAVNPALRCDAG